MQRNKQQDREQNFHLFSDYHFPPFLLSIPLPTRENIAWVHTNTANKRRGHEISSPPSIKRELFFAQANTIQSREYLQKW